MVKSSQVVIRASTKLRNIQRLAGIKYKLTTFSRVRPYFKRVPALIFCLNDHFVQKRMHLIIDPRLLVQQPIYAFSAENKGIRHSGSSKCITLVHALALVMSRCQIML